MSIIYQPKGKAREYSPLAANLYEGCNHGCQYCYAPLIRYKSREVYCSDVHGRRDIIHQLRRDCRNNEYSPSQVLLCFMGDPYCTLDETEKLTRSALELLLEYHIPAAVLTKGGKRALRDIDILQQFGVHAKIGATMTFLDDDLSKEWEPGAATGQERIETLRKQKAAGLKTWASFEPVIDPAQSLALIHATLDCVDEYKVGKINNFKGLDKKIDWTAFLESVVDILRNAKKPFYIKDDLRAAAPTVKLYGNECLADEHCLRPFEKDNE